MRGGWDSGVIRYFGGYVRIGDSTFPVLAEKQSKRIIILSGRVKSNDTIVVEDVNTPVSKQR